MGSCQYFSGVGTNTAAVCNTLSGVSDSVCLCTRLLIWLICHYTPQGCIMRGTFANPVNPHKKSRQFFLQTYMFQWRIFWICIWVKVNSRNKMVIIAWSPAAVCLVRFDGWKNPWAKRFQTATLPHSSKSYGGPLGTRNSFSKYGFIHNSFQYFY